MRPWLSPSSDGGKSGGKAGEEEEEEEMMAEPNSTEERTEGGEQKQQFDSKGGKAFSWSYDFVSAAQLFLFVGQLDLKLSSPDSTSSSSSTSLFSPPAAGGSHQHQSLHLQHQHNFARPQPIHPPAMPAALSCSMQLLLACAVKLARLPQLAQLPRQDRLALAASCWPQLWALQLAQSGAEPSALLTADRLALLNPSAVRLARSAHDLRALGLDQAEWAMVECLVSGGSGEKNATKRRKLNQSCLDYFKLPDPSPASQSTALLSRVRSSLRASARLSLARHHLVSRPSDPARLPRVLLAAAAAQEAAAMEVVVRWGIEKDRHEHRAFIDFSRFFFAGDATLPILLVTNVVLQQQQ